MSDSKKRKDRPVGDGGSKGLKRSKVCNTSIAFLAVVEFSLVLATTREAVTLAVILAAREIFMSSRHKLLVCSQGRQTLIARSAAVLR
jgi:hypothetical protein